MKLLVMQFPQSPVTSSPFDPNILLSTLFSNILSVTTPHCQKISLLRKITKSLRPERIPWINDLSESHSFNNSSTHRM
jgi:hypothetical protein